MPLKKYILHWSERTSHAKIWSKNILSKENSKCKGSEAEKGLEERYSKKVTVVGAKGAKKKKLQQMKLHR